MSFTKTLLVAIASSTIALSSIAQTADEIITKHVEALGGKEKLASLNSYRMTGSMSTQGVDVGMVITKLHMKGVRADIDVNGTSNYQVANAEKGSVFMPIMGMNDPQPMDADQLKSMMHQADIQGSLFNYKDKGSTVSYDGKVVTDGSETYKLTLTLKDGDKSTYYIDTKTNLINKVAGKRKVNGEEIDLETTYADYKKNDQGFMFPYSFTTMQGTTVFSKIETNIPVDESVFKN
jgi:hypothetical protein